MKPKNALLDRNAFVNVPLKQERISIKELGGDVIIQQLSARQMGEYIGAAQKAKQEGNVNVVFRDLLLIRTIVDEGGKPIFSEGDAEIIAALPGKIVVRLYSVAARLNPISDDEAEEKEKKDSAKASTDSSIASCSEPEGSTSEEH